VVTDASRPRIDFIITGYALGGMERQLAFLLENRPAWAEQYSLRTITFEEARDRELAERFERLGIPNVTISRQRLSFPEFVFRLYRTIRTHSPDTVHTFLDGSASTWGRLCAVLARVPVIVQSDRSLRVGGTPLQRRLRPWLDRHTDLFLPNAEEIGKRIVATGVPVDAVHVVTSAVDLELFDPRPEVGGGSNDSGTVLGFVGRLDRVKRVDLLLDALLRLPVVDRPARVLIAGAGPDEEPIRRRIAADAWLQGACHLEGAITNVPEFLARIDYLVLPSEIEGFPNAVLEAMAMAKPIVATKVSDVPRLIEGSGFLAEPGSAESLAEAIRKMQLCTAQERQALGAHGRKRVVESYDIHVVAERFWSMHRRALIAAGRLNR